MGVDLQRNKTGDLTGKQFDSFINVTTSEPGNMTMNTIAPHDSISLFVKNIITIENNDADRKTSLPFYADGYPGIMFQITTGGLYVLPQNKKMPDLFLYGQTIHPIELQMDGTFRLIVFQLYPFVINSFFGVKMKDLNDDCFDITRFNGLDVIRLISQLKEQTSFSVWTSIISRFLRDVFKLTSDSIDFKIQQAIQLIVVNKGLLSIKELTGKLKLNERTFERRFITQTGVTPKQFSKMIQFQFSLADLTSRDYSKLTDIVYENGFADQSHFIRVFKAFTGKTPKSFTRG